MTPERIVKALRQHPELMWEVLHMSRILGPWVQTPFGEDAYGVLYDNPGTWTRAPHPKMRLPCPIRILINPEWVRQGFKPSATHEIWRYVWTDDYHAIPEGMDHDGEWTTLDIAKAQADAILAMDGCRFLLYDYMGPDGLMQPETKG